jgi:hypothetical protein
MSLGELIARDAGASLDPTGVGVISWYGENFTRLGGRSLSDVKNAGCRFSARYAAGRNHA